MRKPIDVSAVVIMTLLCLTWGTQQQVVKATADDVAPLLQMLLRSGIAAVLVGASARLLGRERWLSGIWWRSGLLSGILFSAQLLLVAIGLHWTSAAHMTVFLYTAPFFAAVGLHLRFPEERLSVGQCSGMLLAFGGIVVTFLAPTAGEDTSAPGNQQLLGDFLGLCAGAAWGATLVVVRGSSLSKAPSTQTLFCQLGWACILLLPVAWLSDQLRFVPTNAALASLGFQAIGVAFASHLVWYWMLRNYLASKLGMMSFMTPLFAVGMGVLLWQEPVTNGFIAGTALTLLGLITANLPSLRRRARSGSEL
ncbi:DMT family transporter [Pseudomonas putida]|uniref:DMT family transporter n=1 Tax=Pseudomonas putida TaxID=303 RepID=UPI003F362118